MDIDNNTENKDVEKMDIDDKKRKIKEYMVLYRKTHINEYKKYKIDNKEHEKEYNKKYYQNRKITGYKTNIIECSCGCLIQQLSMPRHIKTIKHILLSIS
jgi:hypothetical protein